jgi:hypothetical protein
MPVRGFHVRSEASELRIHVRLCKAARVAHSSLALKCSAEEVGWVGSWMAITWWLFSVYILRGFDLKSKDLPTIITSRPSRV